jgi:hypothetical protein
MSCYTATVNRNKVPARVINQLVVSDVIAAPSDMA